jgi:nicotinamidase-related amidase
MAERIWDRFLTDEDKAHLAVSREKKGYGFGKKAAVLSVDNYRGGLGDRPEPLLEAIKTWPSSTGLAGWEALGHVSELLAAARAAGIPVIHTTGLAEDESGMRGWRTPRERAKVERTEEEQERFLRRYDIVEEAAPLPGEVVFKKNSPSAFFGTPLAAHLMSQGIDTLLVCGESASGCVRATVVDGCSYRLHMIIVEECVYERHVASLAMSLFDMDQKYGDVISLAAALDWLKQTTDVPMT